MTKEDMYRFQNQLDKEKYKLVDQGIGFCFVIREGHDTFNVGAGSGEDMMMLMLHQLYDLYHDGVKDKHEVTPERFAESMKQNLIKFMKAHSISGEHDG